MNHPMKEALKKHMSKAKASVSADPIAPSNEGMSQEMEERVRGDKAPEAGEDAMAHPMMNSELGPEHLALLEQLLSQVSHPGRDAMSLEERSAPIMREKMALMGKPKK